MWILDHKAHALKNILQLEKTKLYLRSAVMSDF